MNHMYVRGGHAFVVLMVADQFFFSRAIRSVVRLRLLRMCILKNRLYAVFIRANSPFYRENHRVKTVIFIVD